MIITGYRIKSTDFGEIEAKIDAVRKEVKQLTENIYYKKLAEEIAFLCDSVALNILQRSENESIFNSAVGNVNQMIRTVSMTGAPVNYNTQVYAHVMSYKGYTYLKVICPNRQLIKAFKNLESYSLSESDCEDKNNEKNIIWQKLHGLYEKREPMSLNLTHEVLNPDHKKLVYPTVAERCAVHARHNVENRLLNQIAGGEQIAPYRLMPFLDTAIAALDKSDVKSELYKKTQELMQILPDLNGDDSFIFGPKNDNAEESDSDDTANDEIK